MSDSNSADPSIIIAPVLRSKVRPNTNFSIPAIPIGIYPLIGMIAVYHGDMEREINSLLATFVAACPVENDDIGWEGLRFLPRCSLIMKKAHMLLWDCPETVTNLKRLIDEVRLRHAQRNVIVHGQYEASFPPKAGEPAALRVIGKPYRERAIFDFTEDDLETIRHEYGALVGALRAIFTDDGPNYMLTLQDRRNVRDRVQSHRPDPATRAKLPRRQISSPR